MRHHHLPPARRRDVIKSGQDPVAKVGETFPPGRAMRGQSLGCQRAEIGQIGEGHPLPLAEILLGQTGIMGDGTIREQKIRRHPATQERRNRHPRNRPNLNTFNRAHEPQRLRRIGQHGRHIAPPGEPPVRHHRRVPDHDQFGALGRITIRHPRFLLPSRRRFCFEPAQGTSAKRDGTSMAQILLITGGARSGKSAIAEERCLGLTPEAVYIATAQAFDAEMEARIALHRARRGPEWRTVQEPLDLVGALDDSDSTAAGPARLVDCLTLWLSNLMLAGRDWETEAQRLTECLARQRAPVILVTNEVGLGIVPDNALARAFRDAAGILNQRIARQAAEVILAVSGYPMKVK